MIYDGVFPQIAGYFAGQLATFARIIQDSKSTRSASDGSTTGYPRLRFGLVWRTVRSLSLRHE